MSRTGEKLRNHCGKVRNSGPGMSGWEVAEAVKSINPKVPVAIITGWNVDLQESEMKERGVELIAYKPFEVNRVLELVQEGMKIQEKFRAA